MDNIPPDIRPDIRLDIQLDIRPDIRPDIRLDIQLDIRPSKIIIPEVGMINESSSRSSCPGLPNSSTPHPDYTHHVRIVCLSH